MSWKLETGKTAAVWLSWKWRRQRRAWVELVTETTWLLVALLVADSHFCPFSPGAGCFPPCHWIHHRVVCILRNQHKYKHSILKLRHEHCYCSVAQLCPTLYDPRNCSTPGFPVPHHLLEFAQTHVHWVSDAIQPSCPLSSPSPPALSFPASGSFSMSWLFTSGEPSIEALASASVLPMNIQGWFPLGLTGLTSLQSIGFSRVFSKMWA